MKTGENKTGELKRPRNYSLEHALRRKRMKRMTAEIEKEKASQFESLLKSHNITYSAWLNNQIEIAFKEWDLNFLDK
jgi:hypothetical protein